MKRSAKVLGRIRGVVGVGVVVACVLAGLQLPAAAVDTPDDVAGAPVSKARPKARTAADVSRARRGKERAAEALARTAAAGKQALTVQRDSNARALSASATTSTAPPTSTTANGGGDYSATPLTASSSWEAGGSSGAFSWSYPLRTPPTAAGPSPQLSLGYNSAITDGRTSNSNNQSSLIGEGFTLTQSYITRQYNSCKEDDNTGKYDQCWKFDNASLVLNGKSSELVKLSDTSWRLKEDDGTRVERLRRTGTPPGATAGTSWNGDNDSEYWVITTQDGIKYYFGMNILPGATSTSPKTNSTWVVPVAGDDAGEPCRPATSPTFATSFCNQAWRWNLDYVVDPSGNAMTEYYVAETNYYGKNGASTANTVYTRGGYPDRIEYGLRSDALFATPPQKVTFTVAERCLTTCTSLTSTTKQNWPDVPFDSVCASGSTCKGKASPAFYTRKRITGVTTWVLNGTTPRKVDSWALTHLYLDPGDTGDATDQSLWLSSLKHTGEAGTPISQPSVDFSHVWLANRVDSDADNIQPLNRPRLYTITSESGAITTVNYLPADCTPASKPVGNEDDNHTRCYPTYWYKGGATTATVDWFQKYPVASVEVTDTTGGSPPIFTQYSYDNPGWRWDRSPFTLSKYRTWSDWRGFERVTSTVGRGAVTSKVTTVYLRGMSGNRKKDGTTPTVMSTGIDAPAIEDKDAYAGFTRETMNYLGSQPESGTISTPVATARGSYSYPDSVTVTSNRIETKQTVDRKWITSTGTPHWRTRTTTSTFDGYGYPVTVDDQGDDAKTGDETCTRTWYARNDSANIVGLVSRTRVLAVPCSQEAAADLPATSDRPGDVISDTATTFDAATAWTDTQTPTRGLARWTGRAERYSAGTPVWQQQSTTTYDALGRPLVTTDANLVPTTTAYNPAGAGPNLGKTVTNARGHVVTTAYDPAWGVPTKVTDANGKVTEEAYDALGRLTSVWLPQDPRATATKPAYAFAYGLSKTAPAWTSTTDATAGFTTSYKFVDSLYRDLQTQLPSPHPSGGTVVTDTIYDDRGLVAEARAGVWVTGNPSSTRVGTNDVAPSITVNTYDGVGRLSTTSLKGYGTTKWTTTRIYQGDAVLTSAVDGGQATRQVYDIDDQLVEKDEYASKDPSGPHTTSLWQYTPGGQVAKFTADDGAVWTSGYDIFGRETSSTDPDAGPRTKAYTKLDQLDSTTDARGRTLYYDYDNLGRKTADYAGARDDAHMIAAYTFDTLAKGHPVGSIRYVGGKTGQAYERRVGAYDAQYRVTESQLILPANDPLVLAGVPSTVRTYANYDKAGILTNTVEPAVAGQAAEVVTRDYNALKTPTGLRGASGYVQSATYDPNGNPTMISLATSSAAGTPTATIANTYEPTTNRLATTTVTDTVNPSASLALRYTRDTEGNVLEVEDQSSTPGQTDTQCFAYDGYQRLSEAWTPAASDCSAPRSASALGGPSPYWTSWGYQGVGQRSTQTEHGASGDVQTTYAYAGGTKPRHAVTGTTTTAPGGSSSASYDYDATGNTISRPGPSGQQTLTWNDEGRLDKVSQGGADSSYLYDADGKLLIRRSTAATGDTVLYLGSTEVHLRTVGGQAQPLESSRFYAFAGKTVAVRTATAGVAGSKLTFLVGNDQGTASVALDATTMARTKRYFAPFGGQRSGASPTQTWVSDHGFLDKSTDAATGLVHVDAREYDPGLGKFVSADPVVDYQDAQSLTGYAYANNTPITGSDPTGQMFLDGGGCGCSTTTKSSSSSSSSTASISSRVRPPTVYYYYRAPLKPVAIYVGNHSQKLDSLTELAGFANDSYLAANTALRQAPLLRAAKDFSEASWAVKATAAAMPVNAKARIPMMNLGTDLMRESNKQHYSAIKIEELNEVKGLKAGGALAVVSVGIDVADAYSNGTLSTGMVAKSIAANGAGFAASMGTSIMVGAAIGTFIPVPVVGTVVGAAAGAVVGIFVTGAVKSVLDNGIDDVGGALKDGASAVADTGKALVDMGGDLAGGAADVAGDVGGAVASGAKKAICLGFC